MNTTVLRRKRVLVSTAAVAALAVGGGVWATTANADVRAGERDRVAEAAVRAVGGGTATDVDTSDDPGEAYEVDVRKDDGTEVDVALDENLKEVSRQADTPDGPDSPDRVLSAAERASAEKAATQAVGGGTVTDVEGSDDQGVAYEVEVRAADGTEWDVALDSAFAVVTETADGS